jgi:CBS domain-containing protein
MVVVEAVPRHRLHHDTGIDLLVADRVRSELGPMVKTLDQPRIHVMVVDGVAILHGDVADGAARAQIESRVCAVAGVCGVHSHLHVGLLASDTVPSTGRDHEPSALARELHAATRDCGYWSEPAVRRVLSGVLGVFALRLTPSRRRVFVNHLPHDVRPLALPPRWIGDEVGQLRREHDFAQTVALVIGTDVDHADRLVRRVLPVLRRHAPLDSNLIARGLPPELCAIWVGHPCAGSTSRYPEPRPVPAATTCSMRAARLHQDGTRVGDVMTRDVVSVTPEASIFVAFDTLRRHRIRHLPIVRGDGHCVGVVDAVWITAHLPEALVSLDTTPLWRPGETAVPLSVLPDTPLRRAAAEMDDAGTDACCVVDRHGRLVGVLTCHDIIATVAGRSRSRSPATVAR